MPRRHPTPRAATPAVGPPRAKKSLGQHFLRDTAVLDKLVAALQPVAGEHVVEIGPGRGVLTERLLEAGLRVVAVELDRELVPVLHERFGANPRFHLVEGDARRLDYATLGDSFKVAGNLPYNVATVITARLLEAVDRIPAAVLMYQREVAQRIAAAPGTRTWGALSCFVQYHADVEYLLSVPPGAFSPPPKIHSGVVRLTRKHGHPPLPADEKERFFRLVRRTFGHRRKTLLNAFDAAGVSGGDRAGLARELEEWGIDSGRRPETFSLDEMLLLWKILGWRRNHPHSPDLSSDVDTDD